MALLKGKELQERLKWFEDWKSKSEESLEIVRSTVSGLDFTSESLILLESYLLEKFDDPMDVYSKEHKELLDSV